MEQLAWKPRYNNNYAYTSPYSAKDLNYTCKRCGHKFVEVASVPFRCPDCNIELPSLNTLIGDANQDVRVKQYAAGG